MSQQDRLAALITALGTDYKALQAAIAGGTGSPRNLPSYVTTAANLFNPDTSMYNLKGPNMKKARAGLARALNGGRMDILAIGDSVLIGFDGTDTKDSRSIPRQFGRHLIRSLGTVPAGSGLVCPAAYSTALVTDVMVATGTVTYAVGVCTMYAGSTMTYTSEQAGTIADVYYDDRSTPFTVSIDGAAAVTVTPTGTSTIKRYRVTGLTDTYHSIKATSGSNWLLLAAMAVHRASGIAVHNIGYGGSRASVGNNTNWWLDSTASNNLSYYRKGAFDVSGYTPDLVVVSLGANDVTAAATPSTITAALATIRGWYPNSDYLFCLWPGLTTHSAGTWDAFCAAMYPFADDQNVALADFRDLAGTAAEAVAMGLIGSDNAHANAGAQNDWARRVAMAIAGPGPGSVITTPSGGIGAASVPEGTVLVEYTP